MSELLLLGEEHRLRQVPKISAERESMCACACVCVCPVLAYIYSSRTYIYIYKDSFWLALFRAARPDLSEKLKLETCIKY